MELISQTGGWESCGNIPKTSCFFSQNHSMIGGPSYYGTISVKCHWIGVRSIYTHTESNAIWWLGDEMSCHPKERNEGSRTIFFLHHKKMSQKGALIQNLVSFLIIHCIHGQHLYWLA